MTKENPCYHCYIGATGQCYMTRCEYQHEPWSQDVECKYIEDEPRESEVKPNE
jgi:hypothetical protein